MGAGGWGIFLGGGGGNFLVGANNNNYLENITIVLRRIYNTPLLRKRTQVQ